MLRLSLRTTGMNGLFSPGKNQLLVDWQDKCRQQEFGHSFENRYATITYKKSEVEQNI